VAGVSESEERGEESRREPREGEGVIGLLEGRLCSRRLVRNGKARPS